MNEEERRETEIKQIPTEDILPDPRKPLGKYTWRELAKLALKIKICFGAPLPVAPAPASNMYILLSDDKKLRAALLLGLNSVPCEIIERSVSDLCTEDVWDILGTMSPSDNHIVLCLTEAGRLDLLTLELREQLLNVVSKPGRTVILYDKQDVSIMLGHCPEVDVCIPASCRWSIEEDASPVERRIDLWHRMTNDEPGSWDELDGML